MDSNEAVDIEDGEDYSETCEAYISDGSYNDDDNYTNTDVSDYEDDVVVPAQSHKTYTVLKEADIQQSQEECVATVSALLSITEPAAGILLRHYHWFPGHVYETWFADESRVRECVGLLSFKEVVACDEELVCGICFETYVSSMSDATVCGHAFCSTCLEAYISTSIKDGPGCLTLRCPEPSCTAAITVDMIRLLVPEEDMNKYTQYLIGSYVEGNPRIKWCPAPGCDYAIEIHDSINVGENYDVCCLCSYRFCWNCTEESHSLLSCDAVANWNSKIESQNADWVMAYTKPCPKCKRPIEKNHGCTHMTCRSPCKFQFCWLCLCAWSEHESCNGYKRLENEKKIDTAKKSLQKYMHYFERWATNKFSQKKALEDLNKFINFTLDKLSHNQSLPERQLKFISEAWEQIVECRRVLRWTYAYAYNLPEEDTTKIKFFEYLQGQAEANLERLHECAEKDLRGYIYGKKKPLMSFQDFSVRLIELTNVTRNYFENLVKALENGLSDVDSQQDRDLAKLAQKKGVRQQGRVWR